MVVIAIDPGGTTAIVIVRDDKRVLEAESLKDLEGVARHLNELLRRYYSAVVVCEDFIGSGRRDANVINTLQIVGAVKAVCALNDVRLVMQQPYDRKAFLKEATLPTVHLNDAQAHALAFLERTSRHGLT